jgi:hypothetical protein
MASVDSEGVELQLGEEEDNDDIDAEDWLERRKSVAERTVDKDGLRMQLMSDVHLEFRRNEGAPEFDVSAPILVLAGDVGNPSMLNYRRFLWHQADRYDKVFVVAGYDEKKKKKPTQLRLANTNWRFNLEIMNIIYRHVRMRIKRWRRFVPRRRICIL